MILVLYNIILITNFKLIEMCIKSSPMGEGSGEGPVVVVVYPATGPPSSLFSFSFGSGAGVRLSFHSSQ